MPKTTGWYIFAPTARTEVLILSVFDMIMSTIWLTLCSGLIILVYQYPELLQEYVNESPEMRQDVGKLLQFGAIKKAIALGQLMLRPAVSLILGVLLFVGAKKSCHLLIRIIFIFSIVYIVVDLLLLIPRTIYLQHGGLFVLGYVLNFIYMVYELRVVYCLMNDLSAEEEEEEEAPEEEEDNATVIEVVDGEEEAATPKEGE